jgi:hypothetical protein
VGLIEPLVIAAIIGASSRSTSTTQSRRLRSRSAPASFDPRTLARALPVQGRVRAAAPKMIWSSLTAACVLKDLEEDAVAD